MSVNVKQSNTNNGGIGFVGLLTILFIALKLTGFITWSWIWVLSPIWITFSVAMILIVGLLAAALFFSK